jgi:hypothetical protein
MLHHLVLQQKIAASTRLLALVTHKLQNDGMAIIFWALLVEKVAKRTRVPLNCASYLGVELFSLSIKYSRKATILACLSCY